MKLLVVGQKKTVRESLHDFVTRRLYFALGRFAPQIERVTARVGDMNGPRGGVDKQCRIEVKLRGLETVVREARADDLEEAASRAAESVERGVARAVERRRRKRRCPGVSMAGPCEPAMSGKQPKEPNTPGLESGEL